MYKSFINTSTGGYYNLEFAEVWFATGCTGDLADCFCVDITIMCRIYEACAAETSLRVLTGEGVATFRKRSPSAYGQESH
jgi:hypothetical protein